VLQQFCRFLKQVVWQQLTDRPKLDSVITEQDFELSKIRKLSENKTPMVLSFERTDGSEVTLVVRLDRSDTKGNFGTILRVDVRNKGESTQEDFEGFPVRLSCSQQGKVVLWPA